MLNYKFITNTIERKLKIIIFIHYMILECNAGEFKCNTGSECIPIIQVCDNTAQCTDRSDEYQCVQLNGTRLLARYV